MSCATKSEFASGSRHVSGGLSLSIAIADRSAWSGLATLSMDERTRFDELLAPRRAAGELRSTLSTGSRQRWDPRSIAEVAAISGTRRSPHRESTTSMTRQVPCEVARPQIGQIRARSFRSAVPYMA